MEMAFEDLASWLIFGGVSFTEKYTSGEQSSMSFLKKNTLLR